MRLCGWSDAVWRSLPFGSGKEWLTGCRESATKESVELAKVGMAGWRCAVHELVGEVAPEAFHAGGGEQGWLYEYWDAITAELGLSDDCELHVNTLRSKARASAGPGGGAGK